MNDIAVKMEGVSKYYKLYGTPRDRLKEALHPRGKEYHKKFFALNDINLTINKGEIVGIIGSNGSGKSTLLKLIAHVLTPNSGKVEVNGNISALLELGAGFNPEFTGIENLYFYATILGLSKEVIDEKLDDILAFADIGEFIHQPLKTYSNGMKARLGFAIATEVDPDILIIDEVLAVGDATFQRKCYARIESLFNEGKTVFIVSHNRNSIVSLCDIAIHLDNGSICRKGNAEDVMANYDKFINRHYHRDTSKVSDSRRVGSKKHGAGKTASINSDASRVFFDESLTSNPVQFQSSDVNLVQFSIRDLDNHRVNILETGEKYIIYIVYKFNEDLNDLTLTLRFKTNKGIIVTWLGYPVENRMYFNAQHGETKTFNFTFDCNLLEGLYAIDCGIQSSKKDDIQIHLGYQDIYLFKVNKGKFNRFGISFLNFNCLKEHTRNE